MVHWARVDDNAVAMKVIYSISQESIYFVCSDSEAGEDLIDIIGKFFSMHAMTCDEAKRTT